MKADQLKKMDSLQQRGWPVPEWLRQPSKGPIPRTRGDEVQELPQETLPLAREEACRT